MARAPISALVLLALSGCGIFLNRPEKDANGLYQYQQPEQPPHALLVEGEIRDFASLRLEPRAAIETWTDDANYAPKATVDERGQYSLRIDICRKATTCGDDFARNLLFGSSDGCARWVGQFHFRARLGDRCSVTYGADSLPKEGVPLVLWLRSCDEVASIPRRQRGER